MLFYRPDHGGQPLNTVVWLVPAATVFMVDIESVAIKNPQAELEGNMGEMQVGGQARLMSHALRKLTGTIHKSKTAVVFINQIRMKIGGMPGGYGNPETTSGGNALKFYASVRMDIRKILTLKDKDEVFGNRVRVKVVKNKVAPPFREAQFDVLYGQGISRTGEILDMGVECGVVDKSGAWFAFQGERLGQGKENVRAMLDENIELRDRVETALMQHLGLNPELAAASSDPDSDDVTDD